jgi:sec-independent protein translocase protein TatB
MIGGLSMTEVIIILGLALLLLGPDQLPTLAKSLGKGLKELRKATDDIKSQFESEIARIDINEPSKPASPSIAPVPPMGNLSSENDPAAARAAARRAAVASAPLTLVAPEGTVPRSDPHELQEPAPVAAAQEPASGEASREPEVPAEEQKA